MSITLSVRRTLHFVAVAVLATAMLPVVPAAARVPTSRPAAPVGGSADPTARIGALTALAADRQAAQSAAVVQRDLMARRLVEARLAETVAIQQADLLRRVAETARAEYRDARRRAGEIAAASYRQAGNSSPIAALADVRQLAVDNYRRTIVTHVEQHETRQVRQASLNRRTAVRAEREAVSTQQQWHDTVARLRVDIPKTEQTIRDLQAGISNARFWLARWQSIALGTQTPIMGNSVLGPNEIAAWFEGTRRRAHHRVDRRPGPRLRRGG